MLSLPAVHGRLPVGATTFVTPVRPARRIGTAKLTKRSRLGQSNANDNQHPLQLEEVAFTAYYPADTSNNPPTGVNWLLRPLRASLLGLSKYLGVSPWLVWPMVYLFGSLLKIPVFRNAPLLHPEKFDNGSKEGWPLVIFSHGLGGSRTTYSQYCSRIAASGKVVLALEHRDGTGLACMSRRWDSNGNSSLRLVTYLREADVQCANDDPDKPHPMPLRGEQLALRHHEIHIMYERFCDFIDNGHVELEPVDGAMVDRVSWTRTITSGSRVVKYDKDVVLTGHSFGGATALSLLSTAPIEAYRRIPITKVIVLDPWLEPLPTPGPVPYSTLREANRGTTSIEVPVQSFVEKNASDNSSRTSASSEPPDLLVINSETFTLWNDHFARLQEIVSGWVSQGGRIVTLIGSKHISFSDFPVLPVVRRKDALMLMDRISHLSLAFIDKTIDEALKEVPTRKMDIEIVGKKPDGKPKRKLVGNIGDVIVS